MGFLSDLFSTSNENRTRTDMEKKLFVLTDEKTGSTRGAKDSEKAILKEVFDIIEEVPETKKLLDEVAKQGYKFFFQKDTGNVEGCCYADDKVIMLNPTICKNTAEIAINCVHEMTHAMQDKNLGTINKNKSSLNMADQLRLDRAKEAGAYVQESAFANEILKTHPEVQKFVEKNPILMAYKNEMEKSGDKSKAAEKTFKQWYNLEEYRQPYDDLHVKHIIFDLDHTSKKKPVLTESMSPEEMIQKCIYSEDHKKAISPEIIKSKEANGLTDKAADKLRIVQENVDKIWGVKDTSFEKMFTHDTGITHEEAAKQPKPKQAEEKPKESMMATLKKTEQTQSKSSGGASLMGMLAGIAMDLAVDAAKAKVANTVKTEVLKAVKGNDR
ncbi:MAG: hypothetical protein IKR09_04315 [Alphaproteobacteria bacterium]|nr:hypothetical protein [Alphaproteobacteria bacterium]